MRYVIIVILVSVSFLNLCAQKLEQKSTNDTYRNVPAQGVLSSGQLPDMNAFTDKGKAIEVRELCKGKYTVLAAGCLSCPLFHQNYPEIEAAFADYGDKDVQFFYFYKYLRHPELDGYVQAQNISERLLQMDIARKKLETKVPWIADTMDDDMRKGLHAGSWSVYLISPTGEIIYASGKIDRQALRDALSKEVGAIENETQTSDLNLPVITRPAKLVNTDSELGVARPEGLTIISTIPSKPDETYYVKLRAEADDNLLNTGTGRLFLGFYPDPIHDTHWNNLTPTMKYSLTLPEGVIATPQEASAKRGEGDNDAKPRQFWVKISSEKPIEKIVLKLDYYACTSEHCLPLTHEYTLLMEDENRGSRTYGMNKGTKSGKRNGNFSNKRMERLDTNKDGSVSFDEMYIQMKIRRGNDFSKVNAQVQFNRMDLNKDGVLSSDELAKAPQKRGSSNRPKK